MKLVAVFWLVVFVGFGSAAEAQDAQQPPTSDVITTPAPGYAATPTRPTYEEVRREELTRGIKRTRTALIVTSASLAVGLALVVPAFTSDNCAEDPLDDDNFTCNRAGRALLGVGIPFLSVGFYGMLVSGIMLGVRKGKVRRLNERIAYQSKAKFRWDPYRSKFVF